MAFSRLSYLKKGDRKLQRSSIQASATRIGITVEELVRHIESGLAWCGWHKAWEAKEAFYARPDNGLTGVSSKCREGSREDCRQRHANKNAEAR